MLAAATAAATRLRRARSAAASSSTSAAAAPPAHNCVCGLSPCLVPHCAAANWESWSGTFMSDARSLAPYQGTPEAVAASMLHLARLRPGERFVDLGAGDGRVLLHALEHFGAGEVHGWELDPVVHALGVAHVAARLAGRPDAAARVRLHCGDARDATLAGADVVAMYLLPEGHAALRPVLEEQLPMGCGARVVAHAWPVPGWTAAEEAATSMGTCLFLYRR